MSLIQPALPNPASPVELGADLGKGVAVGAAAAAVTEVAPEAQGNSRSDPVPGGGAPRRAAAGADGGSTWLAAASLATALVDRCRRRWWLAAIGLAVQDVDDACIDTIAIYIDTRYHIQTDRSYTYIVHCYIWKKKYIAT